MFLTHKMQRRNTTTSLSQLFVSSSSWSLKPTFLDITSRTFWFSYNVQYFENYWSNTEGMDTRIGHIIKINNNQKKKKPTNWTAFPVVESNIITYYLERKVSYYKTYNSLPLQH